MPGEASTPCTTTPVLSHPQRVLSGAAAQIQNAIPGPQAPFQLSPNRLAPQASDQAAAELGLIIDGKTIVCLAHRLDLGVRRQSTPSSSSAQRRLHRLRNLLGGEVLDETLVPHKNSRGLLDAALFALLHVEIDGSPQVVAFERQDRLFRVQSARLAELGEALGEVLGADVFDSSRSNSAAAR